MSLLDCIIILQSTDLERKGLIFMIKMVNTSTKDNRSDELTIEDLDLPKRIKELQIKLNAELRQKVTEHYNAITKEMKMLEALGRLNTGDSEYNADRKRFLINLQGAFDIYLNEKANESVHNPALCIMAYFLECDETISTVTMGENKVLNIENDTSGIVGVIISMFNMCHQLLAGIYSPGTIKVILSDILIRK